MISVLAPLALTASTGALLALPLTPALRELASRRDAGPLPTRKDDGGIDNFARALRLHAQPFAAELLRCAELGTGEEFAVGAGIALLCGRAGAWQGARRVERLVVCSRAVELPDGFECAGDFYGHESVRSGTRNIFRALLSDSDIVLSTDTQTLRWVHAEQRLTVAAGCSLFGRASAGRAITLSPGCRFERMHAPVIFTSVRAETLAVRTESAPFSKLAQAGIGRTRMHRRTQISADEPHYGDLVCLKSLHLHEAACAFGSVKANGDVELDRRSEVDGALVSTKNIHISSECFVKGPLIAERAIFIDSGVQVGLPDSPTTISAPRIQLAPGSVLHGTIWARVEGRVGG